MLTDPASVGVVAAVGSYKLLREVRERFILACAESIFPYVVVYKQNNAYRAAACPFKICIRKATSCTCLCVYVSLYIIFLLAVCGSFGRQVNNSLLFANGK